VEEDFIFLEGKFHQKNLTNFRKRFNEKNSVTERRICFSLLKVKNTVITKIQRKLMKSKNCIINLYTSMGVTIHVYGHTRQQQLCFYSNDFFVFCFFFLNK